MSAGRLSAYRQITIDAKSFVSEKLAVAKSFVKEALAIRTLAPALV
jgi:hypothetical protein